MIVAGFFLFILSITVELVDVSNNTIQLLSLSMFLYGLGEMINHPIQQIVHPANEYAKVPLIGTGYPRKNAPIGLFFLGVALILFLASIFKLIF